MMKFSPKIANLSLKSGIDYTVQTLSRKNPVNFRNEQIFVSNLLSAGNSKLDSNVLIFDLLAIITCPNCSDCRKDCYAMKAQRQYKGCFNKRLINTYLAINDLRALETQLDRELSESKKRFVRIHSSGDFFSVEYFQMWERLAKKHAGKRFYTYTKSPFADLNSKAINIVDSMPDGVPNFGELPDVLERAAKCQGIVCPYRAGQKNPIHCGNQCSACMTEKRVFFVKH